MLVAPQRPLEIAHRNREAIDREIAGAPSVISVPPSATNCCSCSTPASPMPPRYSGRIGAGVEAVDDLARRLVGEDDRVEALPQLAGADIGVVDRRVRLNSYCSSTQRVQPSSMLPPVHGWYMAMRGARKAGWKHRRWSRAGGVGLGSDAVTWRPKSWATGSILVRARRRSTRDVRRAVEATRRAVLQQPVDGDRRIGARVVEGESRCPLPVDTAGDLRQTRRPASSSSPAAGVFDEVDVDAEQHAERPRGDVVGRLGRRSRRRAAPPDRSASRAGLSRSARRPASSG